MKIINSNKINRRSFIKRSGVAGGGLVITFNLLNSFNSLTPLSDKIDNIKYILTPKGITERTKLTINFMKRKMEEYDELKRELSKNNVDNNKN